jgi:hypothetical protein
LLAALFSSCSWPCVVLLICSLSSVSCPLISAPSLAQHHSLSACPPFPLSLSRAAHPFGESLPAPRFLSRQDWSCAQSWNNASGMHLADRADVRHRMHGISCRVGARVDRIPSG